MSAEYAPGTVAVATVRGVKGVRVMRRQTSFEGSADWAHDSTKVGYSCSNDAHVTDVRPLVVLDPQDAAVEEFVRKHRDGTGNPGCTYSMPIVKAIESQVKPPRIPEPGLWGVVEASWDSKQPAGIPRAEWMRTKGNEWRSCISNVAVRWDELIDPTLIREGVES